MRVRFVLLFAAFCFLGVNVYAQQSAVPQAPKQAPHAVHKKKAPGRKKATATSVLLQWVQGVVPTGATCPSGSGSTAVTSNNVYRATTAGGEGTTPYAKVSPAATSYTDTAVVTATYYYQITALNCAGESAHSTEVSVVVTVPNPLVPNAPTGLTATSQ